MLFDVTGTVLPPARDAHAPPPAIADGGAHQGSPNLLLEQLVQLVAPGYSVHWKSNGDWSMHQLLDALLHKTGPAHVQISSYAFSEQPARSVAAWKAAERILTIRCLLDSRIDVRSASALTLVQNAADQCKLCATHAKVTLVHNQQWKVLVFGSANYTTNKRYECGMISTDPHAFSFHQKWMDDELAKP